MEYTPIGNDIAVEYANQACGLCPTKSEWINVWLVVKRRVRRFNYSAQHSPDESEIAAAETLLSAKHQNADFLVQASNVYLDLALIHHHRRIENPECTKFFKQSAKIIT